MIENLFTGIPEKLPEELFETLLKSHGVNIERIVSKGHVTRAGEWYDQDWDEWVLLIQGRAELSFGDGETASVKAGDYVLIPAHRRHRVEWTQNEPATIWLAVHFR